MAVDASTLSPQQQQDALHIYQFGLSKGLSPPRAKELALAAFHEGGLNPNAVNKQSGAAGDFQLLSSGYRTRAQQLGGLFNTDANEGAILPDYEKFWQQHPDAPPGAAAAAVERSGEGAGYYGAGMGLLDFLGGAHADTPGSSFSAPSASPDGARAFALEIAQNIGAHKGIGALDLPTMLQQLKGAQGDAVTPSAGGAAPASTPVTQVASQYLGVPYKWGGNDPSVGLDCSSFVQQVYGQLGVKLPRTTYEQVKVGQPVGLNELQPGDVIFTEPGHAGPNHEGIYVGGGIVQQSPHTGAVNGFIPLKDFLGGGFVAARRYTGPAA